MRATAILAREHALLQRVLGCAERLLGDAAREGCLDGVAACTLLEFLERFADGCHQEKEERYLFPRLIARAPAAVGRRLRRLLRDHERERALMHELRAHFEAAAYADPLSLDLFVEAAAEYVALQRRHAASEDQNVLPLAERYLDERDDAALLAGFARTDAKYAEPGQPDAAHLAALLLERYAPVGAAALPRPAVLVAR